MAILERIIRVFLGGQPRSSPLIQLFQSESDVDKAIILEETGFPHGGVTEYTWRKARGSGFFKKVHRSFNQAGVDPDASTTVQCAEGHIDELISLIEEEYGELKNYSGNVRDGVVYRVAWGTEDHQHALTIRNPPADSNHYQLVLKLKENATD